MTEGTLTYADLAITPRMLYEQMGYGAETVPDSATLEELTKMEQEVAAMLRPRYCFFATRGEADVRSATLTVGDTVLHTSPIIMGQLRRAEAYAMFVATAGEEFEEFQRRLMADGDMVRVYIADALGSVIAERCADKMEEALQQQIDKLGWRHTNRFSPGYCGWHVREQQLLFSLFPGKNPPCGVRLTESSLMIPIKSVSGIIGLGKEARHLPYKCAFCNFKDCYKRRLN